MTFEEWALEAYPTMDKKDTAAKFLTKYLSGSSSLTWPETVSTKEQLLQYVEEKQTQILKADLFAAGVAWADYERAKVNKS